jgi:class 3 adenylate cyclase/tetratricopeptide (TPR) repeat protein
LADQAVLRSRANEIEAEIRRVTLLFADIRGSTALVQHLDPESAANVLGPPIHAMIEEVERFEGVASDRGDGIMAVFGAPSASEDHTIRACLAALAIQDRLSANPVQVRIGIHYGEVVFRRGRIGKLHMQDVFGAAAHIAARLEQSAEPGTICLSRATYELAQGFVTAVPLDPVEAKGIPQPIERLQLVSADHTANRWKVQAGRGLATFTGRIKELAALRRAAGSKEVGVSLTQIVGPAGIGKSRLVHEFLATDEGRSSYIIKLSGDPRRRDAVYFPVGVWLRDLLGIRGTDSTGEARIKLDRSLSQLQESTAEDRQGLERMLGFADRTRPDLADLENLKPLAMGELIASFIAHRAAGRRIILACEDIDNFDTATIQLIQSLIALLQSHKILLVTTSRTRTRIQSSNALTARTLTLSPLNDADAKQLLGNLHPDFRRRSALTTTIVQKAGGNPLFLEEVASLIASAEPEARRDENTGSRIPDRVEALIADRLARLPKQQRRLVQACAVVGFDVPLRIMARLLDVSEPELHTRLIKLQSEQLLYEVRKYPDTQFSFKHALTRDVAYNTMLPSKRREYHGRILDILTEQATQSHDAYLDDLCMHAVHAQAWSKAMTYLHLAAGRAVERSSYELAEVYLNRALDISNALSHDEETLRSKIEILLGLRVLVARNSKYKDAKRILDLADELARQLGDSELQLRIMVLRVLVLQVLGEVAGAVELAERACEAGRKFNDTRSLAVASYFLGQAHFNLGNFEAAEAALSENVQLLGDGPITGPTGTLGTLPVLTFGVRALVRAFVGEFPGGSNDAGDATKHANESRRPYDLSFAAFAEGFLALQRRNGDAAVRAFRRSLAVGESPEMTDPTTLPPLLRAGGADEIRQFENSRVVLPHYQAGLAHALLLSGDVAGATRWLSQAYENADRTNRYMVQVWAATGLGQALLATGQIEPAFQYAAEAVELALKYGFKGFAVLSMRGRGLVRMGAPGRVAEAVDDLNAALALASVLGMRVEMAHCHAALGLSPADDASGHLEAARHLYAELGMTHWFEHLVGKGLAF